MLICCGHYTNFFPKKRMINNFKQKKITTSMGREKYENGCVFHDRKKQISLEVLVQFLVEDVRFKFCLPLSKKRKEKKRKDYILSGSASFFRAILKKKES